MKRTADISDFLKPIREKPYQAYLSNALQVADVLDWVLQQLGKSEVWQTSFSISEEFIRGCACAYFQIAVDVYTDLRLNPDEWE